VVVPVVVLAFTVVLSNSPRARADDLKEDSCGGEEARIELGIRIAPVPLNLTGKSRDMVGLGSYLVNVGGCNDCHTQPNYADGGDPFQGQPKKINAKGYLGGGGTPFGPVFVPRNLTPDKTGLAEGGHTYDEFAQIIRTGIDLDHAHPQISPLLQVMPWPNYQEMSDRDLRAIYEYLGAIPCVEGGPGEPVNRCNNPPFGVIAAPAENASVASGSWAYGWALDDSGIASVSAAIDSGPATPAAIGQFFPGVKQAYPNYPGADNAGFGFPVPAATAGSHLLVVTINSNDGGKTELKRQIKIN
jgi:hypothetical protein